MSASPALKGAKKKKQLAIKKTKEGDKSMQQKPGTVSIIAKYFEKGQKTRSVSSMRPGELNKHNNNGVCTATPNPILKRSGTRADPEMALQSAAAGQPIVTEGLDLSGHMTTEKPIESNKPKTDQNLRDSSHL